MPRRVLVIAHGGREEAREALAQALPLLRDAGFQVYLQDAAEFDIPDAFDFNENEFSASLAEFEIAIVLGGDGTILRAAELTHGSQLPMIGVNLGHVGFLAESDKEELETVVARVVSKDYTVEERAILKAEANLPTGEVIVDWAVNDITVEKSEVARMLQLSLAVDGMPVSSFGCDGLVFASATGSTAHAFSAGGPVIWPDVSAKIAIPLAAHALFARPLVVGPNSDFSTTITELSAIPGVLIADGRRQHPLPIGSTVKVSTGDHPLRFARLNEGPFTQRLVKKFQLPVSGWREEAHRKKN